MGKYREIIGDLFEYVFDLNCDVVAQGCNAFCIQGGGIAPIFVKHFATDQFNMEAKEYEGNINKLGTIDYQELAIKDGKVVEWDYTGKQKTLYVVNMYTQYNLGKNHKQGVAAPIDYEAFTLCMRKLNHTFSGEKIAMPAVGAGLSGGSWLKLSKIIKEEITDADVTIVLLPDFKRN